MYLGIIILLAVLCYISIARNNKYLIYYSLFILTLVDGLRYETGTDWLNYLAFFKSVNNDATEYFESGYVLFNYTFQLMTKYYNVLLLAHAALVYKFIYLKLYNSTKTSITILALYGLLLPLLGSNRQLIALIFITASYISLYREERYKPYLLIMIAVLFHKSAILVMPIVLMYGKKWSSLIIFYALAISTISIINNNESSLLIHMLDSYNLGHYMDYINIQSDGVKFIGVARKTLMFSVTIIFYMTRIEKIPLKDKNLLNFSLNLMLISYLTYFASAYGFGTLNYRLDIYFGILGFAICVGTIYNYLASNLQKFILITHVLVFSILQYFLNPYRDLYEPYISIFENSTRHLY